MKATILVGDVLDRLRELPDESVQCVITSPPYWGLRDYGVAGQLGLEKTPEEFITKMVEVFSQVRRVLRGDGTLWLNMGDSYTSGGRDYRDAGKSSYNGGNDGAYQGMQVKGSRPPVPSGLKPKDLCGIPWMLAFALRAPYTDWQIKSEAMRAWVAGIIDGEGCITILRTKSSHSDSLSFPPIVQVHMCDKEPLQRLVDVAGSSFGAPQMPPSHIAERQRESYQWKLVSERAAKLIAEIYPFLTCKRKQAIVVWNHQMFRSARGNGKRKNGDLEKEQFCKDLINKLNQRQPVDIPSWMIEPRVVQTPGWYLRQDCIWAKSNPMPESVTDRCTKSHEYLFLMTKSARYYYDAEAIKEECAGDPEASRNRWDTKDYLIPGQKPQKRTGRVKMPDGWDTGAGGHGSFHRNGREKGETRELGEKGEAADSSEVRSGKGAAFGRGAGWRDDPTATVEKRNKRSVWEIATQPYAEAHFATFPEALVEPCILAGSKVGDTVLDPFCGSGTTGAVALRYHREFIGIELNQAYAALAEKRVGAEAPMFNQVEVVQE